MDLIKYDHDLIYHNIKSAREVVPYLINILAPKSVIDIGCGTGSWLRIFMENSIGDLVGVDGKIVADDLLEISKEYILQHNLSEPFTLERKFDLAICLEVAEHLPESAADTFIHSLSHLSDIILFSAAIPGQGGQNHLNEQWFSYWQKKFLSHNFSAFDVIRPHFWDNEEVDWWYRQNMFLLIREGISHPFGNPQSQIYHTVHPNLYLERIGQIKKIESGHIGFRQAFQHLVKAFKYSLIKKLNTQ